MPKKPLTFLLLFWLLYPCVPSGWHNLRLMLSVPGPSLGDSGFDGLSLNNSSYNQWVTPHPFGLVSGLANDAIPPGGLVAEWDARESAWWLLEFRDPFAGGFSNKVKVAARGEADDPGNAFFPAMAAESHFQTYQTAEACRDLRRADLCPRYDDYIREFYTDCAQDERDPEFTLPAEAYFMLWGRNPPDESPSLEIQQFVSDFEKGPAGKDFRANFEAVVLLMRLYRLERQSGGTIGRRWAIPQLGFGFSMPPI